MTNAKHTKASLLALAEKWSAEAKEESGKTLEMGWSFRERCAADMRRDYCLSKMQACIDAAATAQE
jgi:hypothetical protein